MKGLVLKDLYLIFNNKKSIIIMIFLCLIYSLNTDMDGSYIISIIIVLMSISTFTYDDYNNFSAYGLSFPLLKKDIVKSRYLLVLILSLFAFILSLLISVVISLYKSSNIIDIIYLNIATTLGILLFVSILIPILYKFGSEKGRIVLFVLCFGLVGFIALINPFISGETSLKLVNIFNDYWLYISILVVSLSLYISYLVSQKVYLKKEF